MGYRQVYGWLGGAIATAAILCPVTVQASELSDWSFDETSQQLEFALPEAIIPQFFMLAEPARIVLDIPNTQIGNIPTDQSYTGSVERIRVSQYDAATVRIVMDLAPGTLLEPQQADIQFDDANGRRQWRFRPLVSGIEIAVTAPTPPTTPSNLPQPNAAVLPQASPTPQDAELSPEDDEAVISFSAASLQSITPTVPATSRDLPTEVYEAAPSAAVVSVPPVATPSTPVQVPPLTTATRSSSTHSPVEVPPMVLPDLENDPNSASRPATPSVPALPSAATPAEADLDLPSLDPLPSVTSAPTAVSAVEDNLADTPEVEDNLTNTPENASATANVAAAAPVPPTPIGVLTRPNFVEPEAEADSATPAPAAAVMVTPTPERQTTPAPIEHTTAAAVPDLSQPESSSQRNPGQQVAAAAANTPAQAQVIQLPAQTRTITQTRWPELIQFGQPLPND